MPAAAPAATTITSWVPAVPVWEAAAGRSHWLRLTGGDHLHTGTVKEALRVRLWPNDQSAPAAPAEHAASNARGAGSLREAARSAGDGAFEAACSAGAAGALWSLGHST